MDFSEAGLHEVTTKLSYACVNFSTLSIASVDGKQHLSEIVFCALVGFIVIKVSDLCARKKLSYLEWWKLNRPLSLVFRQESLNQVRGMCLNIVVMEASIAC